MKWSGRLASLFAALGKQPKCRPDVLEVLFNWYGKFPALYRSSSEPIITLQSRPRAGERPGRRI
jgi:hypothetical protein